ncbi:MAG: VTT domain-containing protein [Gemmatimonadota bacterium]
MRELRLRLARATATLGTLLVPAAAALATLLLTACGAPESRPAGGAVGTEIRVALESGAGRFDERSWDRLLAEGTREGLVDYPYFHARRDSLDAFLEEVAGARLAELAPAELEALLINAYNALTIRTILDHPGVASIREIDGVWTKIRHTVGGHPLTLDNIEHNVLRPFFRDPRIHFAVNCASRSCAPLPRWAFTGERLEEQLDARARAFLTDPGNVRLEGGKLLLSRYFDWYGEDFVGEGWKPRAETIPEFVALYAEPEVREFVASRGGRPPVEFLEYDWSLNAALPPTPVTAGGESAGQTASPAAGATRGGNGPPEKDAGWVAGLRRWVAGFGAAAPLVYGLVYVLGVVLFAPGAALTIGAGIAFGLWAGTLLVVAAANAGAALAFLLARYLLRGRVERWMEGREKFAAVDRAVGRQGWKVVALTRLSPVFPFNLQNYAYGITSVGFWPYVLASLVAMLPGTLLYVYLGVAGAGVAEAASGAADWGKTVLQVVGLLATLAVVLLVTRVARRELKRATADGGAVAAPGPTDADLRGLTLR